MLKKSDDEQEGDEKECPSDDSKGGTTESSRQDSDEEKRERRLAANRRSALKSRYRKMVLLDELQKTESELKAKNESIRRENMVIRAELAALHQSINNTYDQQSSSLMPTLQAAPSQAPFPTLKPPIQTIATATAQASPFSFPQPSDILASHHSQQQQQQQQQNNPLLLPNPELQARLPTSSIPDLSHLTGRGDAIAQPSQGDDDDTLSTPMLPSSHPFAQILSTTDHDQQEDNPATKRKRQTPPRKTG